MYCMCGQWKGGGGRIDTQLYPTYTVQTYSTSSLCHPDCFYSFYLFVVCHNSLPLFLSNSQCSIFSNFPYIYVVGTGCRMQIYLYIHHAYVAAKNDRTSEDRQKCKKIYQGGRSKNAPAKITNISVYSLNFLSCSNVRVRRIANLYLSTGDQHYIPQKLLLIS